MPTISVIVPAYNSEKTIQSTINSVLNQTFSDFEIIVINDGSIDRTLQILEAFDDKRITILSFENSGAATARNRGIAHAKGNFIAFLDADDLWTSEKLADQLDVFLKKPTVGLVYSWSDYINSEDDFICPGKRFVTSDNLELTYEKLLVSNFLENGSTPLIRREVLEDIGYFDETLQSSQDLDLYLRIAAKYKFETVQKVQVSYRISSGSITSKIAKNEQKEIKFINRLFSQVPQKFRHLKRQKISNLYRYLMLRTVEEQPGLEHSLRALKYLALHIFYRPLLITEQWQFLAVMFLKICLGCLPKSISNLLKDCKKADAISV